MQEADALLLTVDKFPNEYKILKVHGMVQTTYAFETNRNGAIPSRLNRFALEEFTAAATEFSAGDANAIYGISVTPLMNGYVLYTGTAVTVESTESSQ